jgi:16S rRNA (cytosine1402-N4)-methyltransferase
MALLHEPVLVSETVALLEPARGGLFVDCTVGLGGHSQALLEAGASRILGFDRDTDALALAANALARFADRVDLVHADYRDLDRVLDDRGIERIAGALADLGLSSMQLQADGRGFSFQRDEPLDMRMDRTAGPTLAEALATVDEEDLANLIFQHGEERYSLRIARAIVRARQEGPIARTGQLAQIVRSAMPFRGHQRIDPATRTFQALRIWINRELDGLDVFLERAARRLMAGARLAVIAFHSLEDRIVKHTFRALARTESTIRILTKRPIEAGEDEVARNPRARSAKLRAIERLA